MAALSSEPRGPRLPWECPPSAQDTGRPWLGLLPRGAHLISMRGGVVICRALHRLPSLSLGDTVSPASPRPASVPWGLPGSPGDPRNGGQAAYRCDTSLLNLDLSFKWKHVMQPSAVWTEQGCLTRWARGWGCVSRKVREDGWTPACSGCHLLKEGGLPGGRFLDAGLWVILKILKSSRRGGRSQRCPLRSVCPQPRPDRAAPSFPPGVRGAGWHPDPTSWAFRAWVLPFPTPSLPRVTIWDTAWGWWQMV